MNEPAQENRGVEVVEVVPGEYDVTGAALGGTVRVLVPPGVGSPGVAEDELVGAVVAELTARGRGPRGTVDVAQLLRDEPDLLPAAVARVDDD